MIYWQEYDPGAPAPVNNESVVRAIDRVTVDARTCYLASGRRINNPVGSYGYNSPLGEDEEHAYLFGRVRIPPGTVAVRIWCRYAGKGPLFELDGRTTPTWATCQAIRLPKNSGDPGIEMASWVTTAPYLGSTTPPEGNFDATSIPDLTLPITGWQDAWIRITVPTQILFGHWVRATLIEQWWLECLTAENVAI